MDDRALRLALESLLDEPTLKSAHRASIKRGLADLRAQRLTLDEGKYLALLIEHYAATTSSTDPMDALIAAFQEKLPAVDPVALSTAIHALVAGNTAQLDGKSLALTIERRGQTQIANLAERNLVMGDLNQLNISVHIPIPDARFDSLMQAALQRQTRERIINAAQQIESDRLLNLRLEGFVGRVNELAAIREQIAAMRPTGGYVLIKAAAGEGKSSSIAKLIQEAAIAATPHHFIALTTGREYQLGLLRAVVAQLILKHRLTVSYFPEESYPAMKAEFARILDALSKQGIHETIYLDGLDQLQPESDGSRDLSFLPPQPPTGIVIVLGSRPDETLKPLEILHRVDYDLPPLNEADALVLWRSVQPSVADGLFNDLYRALKGNALFVHLAADTMRDQSVIDATSLIKQIERNPSNLFGITLERIKRVPQSKWDMVWKPMLAILLVSQEPLRLDVLGDLVGRDHDTMQDAVWVLGGLVSQGIDQRVALHHLLFRDYLAVVVFNAREVKRWQQRLADWCSVDLDAIWTDHGDAIEQDRRMYARHHYITHLSLAENWTVLWQVLDAGDYGEQKTRFDPSTRLYALDLDRGRESAIKAGQSTEEHIRNLPRLWKYGLLRTSLTSRVDQWPDEAFEILAMVGRTHEVLERIELLSRPDKQVSCWIRILPWCSKQHAIIMRLSEVIRHLLIIGDMLAIRTVANTVAAHGNREHALAILDTSLAIAQSIGDQNQHAMALGAIAKATATHGNINHALTIAKIIADPNQRATTLATIAEAAATHGDIDHALTIAKTIDDPNQRAMAIHAIAKATATLGNIDRALTIAKTIDDPNHHATTLSAIAEAAATHGNIDRALTIAKTIDDPNHHAMTLGVIAKAVATLGNIDRALIITKTIRYPGQRPMTLGAIAKATATHGDIDHALTIAKTIDDPNHHAMALGAIAKATATHGDIDHALTIAKTIDDPNHHAMALGAIAKATATHGDIDRALTIANTIDYPSQRASTLYTIAEVAATCGQQEQALEILNTALTIANIGYLSNRATTLATIAEAAATHGDIDHALTIAKTIDDPNQRAMAIHAIAKATATLGNIDRALTIANTIGYQRHATTLSAIAEAAATHGNIDRALTIAKTIDDPNHHAMTLGAIAKAVATLGNIDRALIITKTIADSSQRAMALGAIAEATATHGDIDRALTIANTIDYLSQRATAMGAIAEATATHGNIDRALTIAKTTADPNQHLTPLSAIAKAAATHGDIDHALTIAKTIADPNQHVMTLSAIANAVATRGDIDRALTIAKTIDYPSQRATTLGIIANAAATHGHQEEALRIFNKALAVLHMIDASSRRADTLKKIVQRVQSITKESVILQKTWLHSTIADDLWALTALITPLLKEYLWLGTDILKEEEWVNEQLKRLG